MAAIGNSFLTLADLYKQQDSTRAIADIIEMLSQNNEILSDAPAMECNQGTMHLTTVRTGLPTPTWRKLYQGVQPTKGTTAQVKDATGMMEDWSEVDAKLVKLAKEPQKFRLNEAKSHVEGISQEFARTIFYGDTAVDPEKFVGFSARFSDTQAPNGRQIIDAGGTGSDNTSIWFITWGEDAAHLLYPEGTQAGLQRDDKGMTTKENPDGSLYDVYREKFEWDVGLSVRDWRSVARIANIDVSALTSDASVGADLIDLMIDAYYTLDKPNRASGRTIIYAGQTIAKFLHKQAMNKTIAQLTLEKYEGRPVTEFLGHRISRVDALLESEERVA